MKLPRNLNGADLQKALHRLGYEATRQRGSHVRITTQVNGEASRGHSSTPTDQNKDLVEHFEKHRQASQLER